MSEARRTSFDRNAALYDSVRPGYPAAVTGVLRAHVTGTRVLEVGAGTGKATELLARGGYTVTAVEPGAQLCAILRAKQLPGVTVTEPRFEDFRGAGFDLVLAAQAWHWMPQNGFALAAAAAPALAILYNEKAPIDRALRAELDLAYARHFPPDAPRHRHDEVTETRAEYTKLVAGERHARAHAPRRAPVDRALPDRALPRAALDLLRPRRARARCARGAARRDRRRDRSRAAARSRSPT